MAPEQNYLTTEDRIYRVNPHDEVAMELAARLKALLAEVEILAVTLGPIIAESELRRCLALGADHLFQIDKTGTMDPWRKAAFLAEAIKPIEPDVILDKNDGLDADEFRVVVDIEAVLDKLDDREQNPEIALPDKNLVEYRHIVIGHQVVERSRIVSQKDNRRIDSRYSPFRQIPAPACPRDGEM